MRLSYSALSAFNQCPKKYQWQYVERIKVPPTPDQFFGILIHEIMEEMLKNDPVIPSLTKVIEIYNSRWNPKVFKGEISEKEFYNTGLEIIKNFHQSHTPGLSTILSTEKFFEIYWEGHKIVGKIDRVDRHPTGEIEIIDYKTNKKLPSEDGFSYDLQLPLYHWAAKTIWNDVDKVKLTLYFLRHNKKITPEKIRNLNDLQLHILSTVKKIDKSDFNPTPSVLCGWCEYLDRCPEGQDYLAKKQKNPSTSLGAGKVTMEQSSNRERKFAKDSLFRDLN